MKHLLTFLTAFVLCSAALTAQTPPDTLWTIARNGGLEDEAWALCADDSNYLYWATFQKENAIKEQFVIYKLDEAGNQIWESKHYGITWWNRAFAIKEKDDYVYAAGTGAINGVLNGPIDAVIICYRKSDGDTVWIRHYNQGYGYEEIDGLELQPDGIYLSGWTKSAGGAEQQDILLLKMDYNGNFLDTAIWGSPGFDEANGEMVMDDSTIYVAGRWNATGAASLFDGESLIASFNRSDLSFKDSAIYDGGNFMDDALGLGTDGTYLYAVGYSTNFGNSQQMLLLKYDKQLNLIWDTAWGGTGNEFARGIIQAADGTLLIAGNISSAPSAPTDIFLMNITTGGHILWYQTLPTDSIDLSHNIIQHNGYVYITANSKSPGSPHYDAWLLKIGLAVNGINETVNGVSGICLYPNPVSNQEIEVEVSADLTGSQIQIFDTKGELVFQSKIQNLKSKISLPSIPSGLYIAKCGPISRKFIKLPAFGY